MAPDLFPETVPAPEPRAPRAKPRVLMHVLDAGWSDQHDKPMCTMRCSRCGAESDWLVFDTITESKRGIPCETCNKPDTTRQI